MGSKVRASRRHYLARVAEADGQPGLVLEWPVDSQVAMDTAVRRVERWFSEERKTNLWIALFIGRGEQEGEFERIAYETAFLWRLQQRLAASSRH
jgi:TorA maturation chaperone TorD